jgi:hypothetical protein
LDKSLGGPSDIAPAENAQLSQNKQSSFVS